MSTVPETSPPPTTPPPTHSPAAAGPLSKIKPLDWAAVAIFGIVLLSVFFPWVSISVQIFGSRMATPSTAAISQLSFWAFLTIVGCVAVICGTLLRERSVWLEVMRLPAAGLVLLALLAGFVHAFISPSAGGELGSHPFIGRDSLSVLPTGIWLLALLLTLAGGVVLLVRTIQTGFAAYRTAYASSPLASAGQAGTGNSGHP